jgi:hypothetical protein
MILKSGGRFSEEGDAASKYLQLQSAQFETIAL